MRLIIITTILTVSCVCWGQHTVTVRQNGQGDYQTIQDAIDNAPDAQIIRVYPGRYVENLIINDPHINIWANAYYNQDPSQINQTIIDGNLGGSAITINDSGYATIYGFTIINGAAPRGGGIYCRNSGVHLSLCRIQNNQATYGGGIFAEGGSLVWVFDSVIRYNTSATKGGGVLVDNATCCIGPEYFQSSVYGNHALLGPDLYNDNSYSDSRQFFVDLDSASVANPVPYYINHARSVDYESITWQRWAGEEIQQDLFVSPDGDDRNTGTSPDNPLRDIATAIYRIASDSLNPRTVHLGPGTFSHALSGQTFPITGKPWVNIKGAGRDETIIVPDTQSAFWFFVGSTNFTVSDLSINKNQVNPYGICAIDLYTNRETISLCFKRITIRGVAQGNNLPVLSDNSGGLTFEDCYFLSHHIPSLVSYALLSFGGDDILIRNCVFWNNTGTGNELQHGALLTGIVMNRMVVEGCRFIDNHYDLTTDSAGEILMLGSRYPGVSNEFVVRNNLFMGNTGNSTMVRVNPIANTSMVTNNTFVDNSGYATTVEVYRTADFDNNILRNPGNDYEVSVRPPATPGQTSLVRFRHNNILGGQERIQVMPGQSIQWLEGNIDVDPLFQTGAFPGLLSADSPCIDAGGSNTTLSGPSDFTGNERYYDGNNDGDARIDIGCHEYRPIPAPENLWAEFIPPSVRLGWTPPPLTRSLTGYRIYRDGDLVYVGENPDQIEWEDYLPSSGSHTYGLSACYGNLESLPADSVTVVVPVGIANPDLPGPGSGFTDVIPNPFNPWTTIRWSTRVPGPVSLRVFNVRGQQVRTLFEDYRDTGTYESAWDGRDDYGRRVSSQVYFLRLQTPSGEHVRKVLMMK